jgi:hypothetical protein
MYALRLQPASCGRAERGTGTRTSVCMRSVTGHAGRFAGCGVGSGCGGGSG